MTDIQRLWLAEITKRERREIEVKRQLEEMRMRVFGGKRYGSPRY